MREKKMTIVKNRKGSVLLAVVCMTTFCLALVTMALAVIKVSTDKSSDNVQRTQAKITAEAALTEFVASFRDPDESTYDELAALAEGYDQDNPNTVTVSFPNQSDFGTVELEVYCTTNTKKAVDGFKVVSTCTYSTQTQTASAYFAPDKKDAQIITKALSVRGSAALDGISYPIEGDVHIEKDGSSPLLYLSTTNAQDFKGNFYSEYNVYLNDATKFLDGENQTGSKNYMPGDGSYFQQAPTVTVKGYFYPFNANTEIKTNIGKSDTSGRNSDDDGYDTGNLSNMDGYLYATKVLFCGNPITVGSGSYGSSDYRPIDVYTYGLYCGAVPSYLDGAATERNSILSGFGKGSGDSLGEQTSRSWTMHGNVYSYKGDSSSYQNGDVIINQGNGHSLTVDGDMFVEGNIYLGNSKLNVTGTLYCSGNIYYYSNGGGTESLSGTPNVSGIIESGAFSDSTLNSYVTAGALSNSVDKGVVRNQLPDDEYDPSYGAVTSNFSLDIYDKCSSNDIFLSSITGLCYNEDTDAIDRSISASDCSYLAQRYADAITTNLDTTSHTSISGGSGQLYDITQSCYLTSSQLQNGSNPNQANVFMIKLTTDDIVVCLPIETLINSYFLIDRSGVPSGEKHFCYFMYYDPSDMSKCYYLGDGTVQTIAGHLTGNVVNLTGADGDGKKIYMNPNGGGIRVADFSALSAISESTDISANIGISYATLKAKISTYTNYNNYIFYMLPDKVDSVFCNNGSCYQGFVYAPYSDIHVDNNSGGAIIGKILCDKFTYSGTSAEHTALFQMNEASGSIMNYVGEVNGIDGSGDVSSVELQYYEY